MDDVQRTVAVLAARVRDAHAVGVWTPLGYGSGEAFRVAEFGVSRAQAYRLLVVANALATIQAGVDAAGTRQLSRTRDTDDAAAARLRAVAAGPDRRLRPLRRRPGADHPPPCRARPDGLKDLDEPSVRAVVCGWIRRFRRRSEEVRRCFTVALVALADDPVIARTGRPAAVGRCLGHCRRPSGGGKEVAGDRHSVLVGVRRPGHRRPGLTCTASAS
ncbi:hypothetical protein AB0C77_29095 [Streptomyces sp. NPDC048629]|uniref:hypothetical protein n=1 Tax=Streptomyces sp. NPDC048629 TaxID=3154824 RepID=UPI003445861A